MFISSVSVPLLGTTVSTVAAAGWLNPRVMRTTHEPTASLRTVTPAVQWSGGLFGSMENKALAGSVMLVSPTLPGVDVLLMVMSVDCVVPMFTAGGLGRMPGRSCAVTG